MGRWVFGLGADLTTERSTKRGCDANAGLGFMYAVRRETDFSKGSNELCPHMQKSTMNTTMTAVAGLGSVSCRQFRSLWRGRLVQSHVGPIGT